MMRDMCKDVCVIMNYIYCHRHYWFVCYTLDTNTSSRDRKCENDARLCLGRVQ